MVVGCQTVVVGRAAGDRFLVVVVVVDVMEEAGLVERRRNRYRHVGDEKEVDLVVERTRIALSSSYLMRIDGCWCLRLCCGRRHVVSLPRWNMLDTGRHCRGMLDRCLRRFYPSGI